MKYSRNEDLIVILYAEKNRDDAFRVIADLNEKGYNTWHFTETVTDFDDLNMIAEYILNAKIVVGYVSRHLSMTSWQKKAIDYAKIKDKKIILVFCEGYTYQDLPLASQTFYSGSIKITSYNSNEDLLNKICSSIQGTYTDDNIEEIIVEIE